ncbi:unnamed protein product [Ostreobium quekettii]|uniref:Sulfatase N-terminal domain-containing protein n=1 Tax=Ostreobium quekettii TaxID=121088 RepID=A0A8S1IM95_9CHLO|nr:unnamed protein product [Ostreobium quekettii]
MLRYSAFLLVIFVTGAVQASDPDRPNILWISVEDIGPHLGCYGDQDAITPTLDALAARGVRYDNVFTTCPVCATNRSSIITGMYPTSIGAQYMRCKSKLPAGVQCFPAYLREAGYYCTNNAKTDYNLVDDGKPWNESSKKAHWRDRADGQPFFAVFNLTNTHESKIWPRGQRHRKQTPDLTPDERQDPEQLTPPPFLPNTKQTRRDWANYLENITQADYYTAKLLAELREDGLEEDTIVFFWSDHGAGLPRNKRWPYDSGLRVPFIVHVPPKFRQPGQGKEGGVDEQLISFVDLAPTVLNLTGIDRPGYLQGTAFLGADLTAPREYAISTRDRMDERNDCIRSVRDHRFRYIRNFMPWKPYAQWISYGERNATMQELRRLDAAGELPAGSQLFMADRKPVEELYDLQNDPHELVNLADRPSEESRAVLQRMRQELSAWQQATGDLGLIPEPIVRQREAALGDCLEILKQPGAKRSMTRIRKLLAPDLAEPERAEMARNALGAEDPTVRYWGVNVLGAWPAELDSSAEWRSQMTAMLDDPSGVVRVAAAAALCRAESEPPEDAVQTLVTDLADENPWRWTSLAHRPRRH